MTPQCEAFACGIPAEQGREPGLNALREGSPGTIFCFVATNTKVAGILPPSGIILPVERYTELTDVGEHVDDEEGEELDDYEVGFLDGYFAARGIEQPTDADFTEAFATLARMVESHDDEH